MPLPPLPPNNELRTCLQGIYLGDDDLPSKVKWLHSKYCCCQLLCHSDAREGTIKPMPIILHSILPSYANHSSCCLMQVSIHLLGFDDFDKYIGNINLVQELINKKRDCYSLLMEGILGPQLKIIH